MQFRKRENGGIVLIEVKNLQKSKKENPVVRNVSFKLVNGAVYGIYDTDETADHTLLALLAGALLPDGGSVRVNGFDTAKDPVKARDCIGYLPHQMSPYPDMTPEEYLTFVADLRGIDYEDGVRIVHELLNDAELRGRKKLLCSNLSDAEKKRLCLAQALVGDPEILILNNPTDSLQERDRNDMLDRISYLAESKTIFLGSDSPSELLSVCDSVIVLTNGELDGIYDIQDPSLKELLSNKTDAAKTDGFLPLHRGAKNRKNRRKPYSPPKKAGAYEIIDDSHETEDNQT